MLKKITISLIFLSLTLGSIKGENNNAQSKNQENILPEYIISINSLEISDMVVSDTIDILISTNSAFLAGFDLKVTYNNEFFTILNILPGKLSDSCKWDFFNARALDKKEEFASFDIWQIVALADMSPGSEKPLCFGLDSVISIARLVVSNQYLKEVPDTVVPIYFLWEDCTDNTISGISGNSLVLSKTVKDYYQVNKIVEGDPFPSTIGTPESCLKKNSKNAPSRLIEFQNGGVEFRFKVARDSSKADIK